MKRQFFIFLLSFVFLFLLSGCIKRYIVLQTQPSGVKVYLNGNYIGKTPCRVLFSSYGEYEVLIETHKNYKKKYIIKLTPQGIEIFPLDIIEEILPFNIVKEHKVLLKLLPSPSKNITPSEMIENAIKKKEELKLYLN